MKQKSLTSKQAICHNLFSKVWTPLISIDEIIRELEDE
ncbi:hypothetical protein MARTH_orf200 [Metamycoplasma arthritidis 158L3-1]|uniref:Uncharacterized protein n=1 Tax=Metamycoplasma arthritidis (strain 158L3-1) TaxID=243272 RepID=B3PM67_META1|nr:hypothetical protein MARTH_orf200 [Metamycoplasma arthritidis 158L3-1]